MPRRFSGPKEKFSLVELFVVMVIIVIMLSLFTPVFERSGAASRVNSTAKSVGSELSLARQYAQTENSYVALIMPGNKATYADPSTFPAGCQTTLPKEYKFTIFRLAYVDYDGTNYNFSKWVDGSTWSYLPKGCSIMEVDSDIGIYNTTVGVNGYSYQPHEPDTNSGAISIVQNVPFKEPLVSGDCNLVGANVRSVIYAPNGKPKPSGAFRHITIGEADWNGTTFLVTNTHPDGTMTTNKSCANQINLEINGFTGGISYATPDEY